MSIVLKHKYIKKVKKVFGEELWVVNSEYCGKELHLKKGYECSLHCHNKKVETFYIVSGSMWLHLESETFKSFDKLEVGDIIDIPIGVYHQFRGLDQDCVFMEFSSHHEDSDSIRKTVSGKMKDDKNVKIIDDRKETGEKKWKSIKGM